MILAREHAPSNPTFGSYYSGSAAPEAGEADAQSALLPRNGGAILASVRIYSLSNFSPREKLVTPETPCFWPGQDVINASYNLSAPAIFFVLFASNWSEV